MSRWQSKLKISPSLAWTLALAVLAVVFRLYQLAGYETTSAPPSSDFYKFYLSGERLNQGKSIYWVIPSRIKPGDPCHPDRVRELGQPTTSQEGALSLGGPLPCLAPNLNPPIFMALIAPLTTLPYSDAWWMWACASTVCGFASIWVLAGTFTNDRGRRSLYTAWGSIVLLLYYPSYANFTLGQVGTLLMLPLSLAWAELRQGHPLRAGAWLGLATGLKPFLGIFVISLLILKEWRACLTLLITATALTVSGLIWLGWGVHEHYQIVAKTVTWTTSNWNGSLIGLVDRAFSGFDLSTQPELQSLRKCIGYGLASLTLLLVVWLLRRAQALSRRDRADLLFLLTVPASVLISPLGWLYYLPWLGLSASALWHLTERGVGLARPYRLSLVLPWLATLLPVPMKNVPTPKHPTVWYGIDSLYAFALLGFFGIAIWVALHKFKRNAV